MEIALMALATAVLSGFLSRFTPVHPLITASGFGMLWAGAGGLIMALFASDAWPAMALVGFAVGVWPAGIGAFVGWLMKKRQERI